MFSPTQSSRKVTGLPSYFSRLGITIFNDYLGLFCPFGLPKWESKTKDLGLYERRFLIVGIVPM